MFQLGRRLLGMDVSNVLASDELDAAGVPVYEGDCRTCADPCDEGHEEYSGKFEIDTKSDMRGSVKPYHRQVLISTGKADWGPEIFFDRSSLAHHLSVLSAFSYFSSNAPKPSSSTGKNEKENEKEKEKEKESYKTAGVLSYASTTRLSILNGSHTSHADDPDTQDTVIILPDYVAVVNVPRNSDGARALYDHALNPAVERAAAVVHDGDDEKTEMVRELRTWTLPYNCLILLCSHKKRDARCHIAAHRLSADFSAQLASRGWQVDHDLPDLSSFNPPLEEAKTTSTTTTSTSTSNPTPIEEAEAEAKVEAIKELAERQLRDLTEKGGDGEGTKTALIVMTSHFGGHKYAGNVVLCFPNGASIWYGRVSPHEVSTIVEQTLIEGKVIAPLLRGGLGISKHGCKSVIDW